MYQYYQYYQGFPGLSFRKIWWTSSMHFQVEPHYIDTKTQHFQNFKSPSTYTHLVCPSHYYILCCRLHQLKKIKLLSAALISVDPSSANLLAVIKHQSVAKICNFWTGSWSSGSWFDLMSELKLQDGAAFLSLKSWLNYLFLAAKAQ